MADNTDELRDLNARAFPRQLAEIADEHAAAQAAARGLTAAEITRLEHNNNRCENWSLIQVGEGFRADRVFDSIFIGPCLLAGRPRTEPNQPRSRTPSLPPGIYSSTVIASSLLENCCLHRAFRVENAYIGSGALLEGCSVVPDSADPYDGAHDDTDNDRDDLFSNTLELPLGLEDGLRSVPVVIDASMQLCACLSADAAWLGGEKVARAFAEYRAAIRLALQTFPRPADYRRPTIIAERVTLRNTTVRGGAFIGPYAVIHGAAALQRATVLSTAAAPTSITNGAVLEGALLQEGCRVCNGARVLEALMLEHSSVSDGATLEHCVLGPNSKLAHGEAHAALIGPFVSFHHQSLLISARWPEGRGNIGYGANVGSNHTSRRADQEIRIGEGMFFGLSAAVKFPADFSEAPYSIIASAVTTLPQTLAYPFSLLIEHDPEQAGDRGAGGAAAPSTPCAPTRVVPGWVLYRNAYMLMRSRIKFARRDRSTRHHFTHDPFSPAVLAAVRRARAFLAAAEPGGHCDGTSNGESEAAPRACYGPGELHGIGKNVLYEHDRVAAIEAYDRLLRREELRARLEAAPAARYGTTGLGAGPGPDADAESGAEAHVQQPLSDEELEEYVTLVDRFAAEVYDSVRRDYRRGTRTIPDYADSHPAPEDDEVVRAARELAEDARRAVGALRGSSTH